VVPLWFVRDRILVLAAVIVTGAASLTLAAPALAGNPPLGWITGTVTDSVSHAGIGGICVRASTGRGSTNASGVYRIAVLASSSIRVGFFSGCGAGNYAPQYYNGKPSLASADPVAVRANSTTSGINAAMVTGGQITGTVTDRVSHAAITGICVKAFDIGGGVLVSAQTNASGVYTLSGLASGSDRVGFFSGCGAGNYLAQYYSGKASLASADPVPVTAGATTPGINAAMVTGGQITGTVTDRATHAAIAGICVSALDSSGSVLASTQTSTSGVYTLSALTTGSDRVEFFDCGAGIYAPQYYKGKSSLASADPVAVTAGAVTSGINAAMVTYGQITGTVTDNASHAPIAGICVQAYNSGGYADFTRTDASGVYTLSGLAAGHHRVEFASGCGAANYVAQYYSGKSSLASADPVTVTDGTTTSGINAAMVLYGQITGTVTDRATHGALAGICAEALDRNGNVLSMAGTDASGAYTISGVTPGSDRVYFFSECGTRNYVPQYYSGKSSLASSDPVTVTAGATTAGINAAMVQGGQITGTVTDSATHGAIRFICVDAYDNSGNIVSSADTDPSGAYFLYSVPPGSVRVEFHSGCGVSGYVTQYYSAKSSLASADPVKVAAGATTAAINAALVAG
jgi:hypothetical protein